MTHSALIGYVHSTQLHTRAVQLAAVKDAGCDDMLIFCGRGKRGLKSHTFKKVLRQLRRGDVLIIYDWVCLAQTTGETIEVVDALRKDGVTLRTIRFPFEITPELAPFALETWLSMARQRTEEHSQRTRAGLKRAAGKLRFGGRPPVLSEDKLALAHQLLAGGKLTMTAVAARLSVARGTLYNAGLTATKNKGRSRGAA